MRSNETANVSRAAIRCRRLVRCDGSAKQVRSAVENGRATRTQNRASTAHSREKKNKRRRVEKNISAREYRRRTTVTAPLLPPTHPPPRYQLNVHPHFLIGRTAQTEPSSSSLYPPCAPSCSSPWQRSCFVFRRTHRPGSSVPT